MADATGALTFFSSAVKGFKNVSIVTGSRQVMMIQRLDLALFVGF